MKTLLVPVDFSGPSDNAVAYATDLANDRAYDEIILAANLYVPIFEQIIPSPDLLQVTATDIQQKKKQIRQQLEALKEEITNRLTRNSMVRFVISDLPLVRAILQQVRDENPALVVIGSNSYGSADDSMTGRQLIELAKVIPTPVLVVPPKSSYRPMVDALVAGEFNSLACIDPLKMLEKMSQGRHPRLWLLNVGATRRPLPVDVSSATNDAVSDLLKGFDYSLHNLADKDILQGVLQFAEDKQVQLIIALPGRHSFLYHLTHQNIQQGILLNAQKPVLILK